MAKFPFSFPGLSLGLHIPFTVHRNTVKETSLAGKRTGKGLVQMAHSSAKAGPLDVALPGGREGEACGLVPDLFFELRLACSS